MHGVTILFLLGTSAPGNWTNEKTKPKTLVPEGCVLKGNARRDIRKISEHFVDFAFGQVTAPLFNI